MYAWLTDNMGTIVTAAAVIAIILAALLVIIRDKRKGKTSCGCDCSHCAMSGSCHTNNGKKNEPV